jgi:diaminopimelate epimerase
MLSFFKYQGTGNDFVMIDDRNLAFPAQDHAYIAQLCDRRFGIGADGLILIQNAENYDFRMVYFNADGKEGSMCGNGGRCAVKFAEQLGIISAYTKFIAVDGEHEAHIEQNVTGEQRIRLKMQNVKGIEETLAYTFLDTGSPHTVTFVTDLQHFDVLEAGKAIRYSPTFAEKGTNVNFVEKIAERAIFVRTYERGVEAETYACGTGATACALMACLRLDMQSPIEVQVLGGKLQIFFERVGKDSFEDIYLAGPAKMVFSGNI